MRKILVSAGVAVVAVVSLSGCAVVADTVGQATNEFACSQWSALSEAASADPATSAVIDTILEAANGPLVDAIRDFQAVAGDAGSAEWTEAYEKVQSLCTA